jgi:protein ImuB
VGLSPRRPRWLVVHLPAFRLERCGFAADEVAVLVAEQKSALRVVARSAGAAERGLRRGMTANEARALVPEVQLEPWDAEGEARDRAALLRAFQRLSDRVRPLGDDDVAVEISGTAALFGGEDGVITAAGELADALGHRGFAVIADDPIAARALALTRVPAANAKPGFVVPRGRQAAALAPLPIEALCGPAELVRALREVGITCVGPFARLDAAAVAGRYGAVGVRLHRVARGLPNPDDPDADGDAAALAPVRERYAAPPAVHEHVVLGGPCTTLEPLWFVLPGLLARIGAALDARDQLAVRLVVRFGLDRIGRTGLADGTSVRVRVGRPTAHPARLERLIRARLEATRLDAPIVELGITVEETCPTRGWQPGLLDRTEAAEVLADLVARLTDGLGTDAVFTAVPVAAWRPEAGWRVASPDGGPTVPERAPVELETARGRIDPVIAQDRWEPAPEPARPALLAEPAPLEVRADPDGAPVMVRLEGGWEPVTRRLGPERLDGDWWRPDGGFARDYWVVEVGATVGWVFRDRRVDRWAWHGWFD